MKTFYINLTLRQRDQIVQFKKQGGCSIMQPIALDGKKPLLRCCSISRREMDTINSALKKGRTQSLPNK
jgi:hypothetical protein